MPTPSWNNIPAPGQASVEATKAAVDAAARTSGYRCVPVSWEDVQRSYTFGGALSRVGPNIADVRLYAKDERLLYTLRGENWNERLAVLPAGAIKLVVGNESGSATLRTVTLAEYLGSAGTYGGYVGLQTPSLARPDLDEKVGVRFQAVFLPVAGAVGEAALEFCTEVYSYQTRSADNPRNLLLLATPQGTSVQGDGVGRTRLFYHAVAEGGAVRQFWLEGERSAQAVGGAQSETAEERQAAAQRGKAVAVEFGPLQLGARFNVQMLIQVPLAQRPLAPAPSPWPVCGGFRGGGTFGGGGSFGGGRGHGCGGLAATHFGCAAPAARFGRSSERPTPQPPAAGISNAARVSRGSVAGTYGGLPVPRPERDPGQHLTVTVTMYYTVAGGVPTAEDVQRCVKDLDGLYAASGVSGRLADLTALTAPAGGFGTGAVPPPPVPADLAPTVSAFAAAPASSRPLCCHLHALTPHAHGGAPQTPQYYCDHCGVLLPCAASGGRGCRLCDYDLCAGCAANALCCPRGAPYKRVSGAGANTTWTTCGCCGKTYNPALGHLLCCAHPAPCTTTCVCIECASK